MRKALILLSVCFLLLFVTESCEQDKIEISGRLYDIDTDSLYLSRNPNLDFDKVFKQLESLPNLQSLELRWNDLTNLPESIGNLKNLKWLNLEENKLTNLPGSIGNLKNLKWLELGRNNFSVEERKKIENLLPNTEISWW